MTALKRSSDSDAHRHHTGLGFRPSGPLERVRGGADIEATRLALEADRQFDHLTLAE